jgi:uncharacterized protein (DUF1499 family)
MDRPAPYSRLAEAGFFVAAASAAVAAVAALGSRIEAWDFRTGFTILRFGACGGLLGALLSVGGVLPTTRRGGRRGFAAAVAGIVLGAVAFAIPAGWYRLARTVPPIHDISTDTEDPPAFSAVLPLRAGAPNPAEYGGEELARVQRAAYPEIRPLLLADPPAATFRRALAAARSMGWEVVCSGASAGRIEAVATTRWFGFRDDVAVRVLPDGKGGSRVDVRSASRVGKGDAGTNARRIRAFLETLSSRPG